MNGILTGAPLETILPKDLTPDDLAQLFAAFNRHDIDSVMAFFSHDCIFDAIAGPQAHGKRFDTPQAIADAFCGVWKAMPDAHWETTDHWVSGERAVSEWLFSGTQADGQRIEAQGADLFRHRRGLITFKQAFRKQRPLLPSRSSQIQTAP